MIQANELRIGNWVLVNGHPICVKGVNDDGINQETEGSYYGGWCHEYDGRFYDWYRDASQVVQPIPLTLEILEKAGFVGKYISASGYELEIRTDVVVIWGTDGCTEGHNVHFPCSSLHQLQNLYLALTGDELKIQL